MNITLAAGGTGGHMVPAHALATELKSRGHGVMLVTDARGAKIPAIFDDVPVGRLFRDGRLIVSSSMPVRDLEWFGGRHAIAHSNRGANGIDGVMSTARGVAGNGKPVVVLIGDLAFCHDANALWGLAVSGHDLRVVVVDNDGGGIFSFLPQATLLDRPDFEQLFGTPHGADVLALAAAYGVRGTTVGDQESLRLALAEPGPHVIRVASDRRRNVEVHRVLHQLVLDALG